MISKKEFLLNSIIKAYIQHLEPIGSGQLKTMYDISYSPATIRGYFKKLGDEGYLAQEHASSGRTPTTEALKEYWKNRLNFKLDFIYYNKLNMLSKQLGIAIFLKEQQNQILQGVFNIENRYMFLDFDSFCITIKYNGALYKFLTDMVKLEATSILEVSKQVGAKDLYLELNKYLHNRNFEIINIKEFLSLCVDYNFSEEDINLFLNGTIMDNLSNGLYFNDNYGIGSILPHQYLAKVDTVTIDNKKFKILVLGQLSKDYEYFYKEIKL